MIISKLSEVRPSNQFYWGQNI